MVYDYEYHAIRNSAGLIDVSPLYKYDIRGKDALRLVNRVLADPPRTVPEASERGRHERSRIAPVG